jgi:hypothetical protein
MERRVTRHDTAKRYQRAAEMTLEQLDWCISYLRTIRRDELAKTLSRNRNHIRERLRERHPDRGEE